VAGALKNLLRRWRPAQAAPVQAPSMAQLLAGLSKAGPEDVLGLSQVGKSFGGLRAVDEVGFAIQRGTIKALIGPNGAGKTTLINMISGVMAQTDGTIRFQGRALDGLRADEVARLGVQRTFQHERLFTQLTVIENVMVGCEHGSDGSLRDLVACGLGLPQTLREEQQSRREAEAWLARVGLAERAEDPVNVLPHGLRKLVEVARAGVAKPCLLLLDETAAGLNNAEKEGFKTLIREMRDQGVTVLLIEHDMDFVMDLSDEVVVINFGRRIADATPAQVRKDEAVIAAYLGA
jgi:ABC-type branched-subunit amino acid transport system ATPase component